MFWALGFGPGDDDKIEGVNNVNVTADEFDYVSNFGNLPLKFDLIFCYYSRF